jgi:thioredoxin 1
MRWIKITRGNKEEKAKGDGKRFFGSGSDEEKERSNSPFTPIVVSDSNFDETLRKYPQVVIDCWAAWCAPCGMIAPVVEELARDYSGRIVFGKLDVDKNPGTARKYRIMSIPALLVFKDGGFVDQIIGAMPRNMLEPKIKKSLRA